MSKGKELEKRFRKILIDAGYSFDREPSIVCENKVRDKNGKERKTETSPDFRVFQEGKKGFKLVEVTNGSGNTPHKRAQRRVIWAAGMREFYLTIRSGDIRALENIDIGKRPKLLKRKLGW